MRGEKKQAEGGADAAREGGRVDMRRVDDGKIQKKEGGEREVEPHTPGGHHTHSARSNWQRSAIADLVEPNWLSQESEAGRGKRKLLHIQFL